MSSTISRGLRRALLLAGLVIGLALPATAKMYEPPKSFTLREKASLDQVERRVLPAVETERLLAEDKARNVQMKAPQPLRFAEPATVQFTLRNSGTWRTLADSSRLWRLRIQSGAAKNINLGITRFDMPAGAKLWIYNPAQNEVDGPYTAEHRSRHGRLWTPMIQGDEIVVEVFVPAGVAEPVIEIGRVNRGYRNFGKGTIPGGGSEQACENDVVCPEGAPWSDQIRAVAAYTVNGFATCTGQMLNNTAGDFKPFFLSAHHCSVDASNDDSVVVFWNFQSATCGTHGPGDTSQNQTGSIFRATSVGSDFLLLELASKPDPAFNVFYGGWDATGGAAPSTVCIHHPAIDVKAITFSNSPAVPGFLSDPVHANQATLLPDPNGDHWQADWSSGATEGGSSGSCLWNGANKRCIGQLHGGPSACGVSTANLHDYYGRLSVSWEGGGTKATRLKDWLDPMGGGATTGLDGAQPPIPGGPSMRIEQTVLDYGNVELGFAFTKAIVIHNDGNADLIVSAVSSNPGSPELLQWPLSQLTNNFVIAPGAAPLVLQQKFLPTTLGAHQIGITVTSNDPAQPSVPVQLLGSGTSPIPMDSVLVLDRSGSMSDIAGARQKIEALATAADLFANLLRPDTGSGTGDKISLVKYNNLAELYSPLAFADDPAVAGSHIADIDKKLNAAALTDPNGLLPQGSTSIGSGMKLGASVLPVPANGRKHVMVVLTDGIENTWPFIDDVLGPITTADPALRIYSVGLGSNIDPSKLQEITNVSNGYHQVADDLSGSSLFDLETFYFKIFANAAGFSLAVDPTLPVTISGSLPIVVDHAIISSSDHSATFLVLDLPATRSLYTQQLVDPKGNVIVPGSKVGGVPVLIRQRGTYTIYKVVFPTGLSPAAYVGDWQLRLLPTRRTAVQSAGLAPIAQATSPVVQIGFAAAVGSDYRLDLKAVSATYLPGSLVTVSATLSDAGWPVRSVRFSATLTDPERIVSALTFYDDGTHGDPVAGDGIWTAQTYNTKLAGNYRIFVRTSGTNAQRELVNREAARTITLTPPAR
jgi:hypothetical protein